MLAVEAGGKKGGADLGGGCRTNGRLKPIERVEESTIEDGWCFDPRGRQLDVAFTSDKSSTSR